MGVWNLIRARSLRLQLFLCMILSLGRPMTGISALVFYSTNLFQMAGIPYDTSQFVTIGVGGISFIMTMVSLFLIDKLGRRTLFLFGSIGQIVCLVVMTISLNLKDNSTIGKYTVKVYWIRLQLKHPDISHINILRCYCYNKILVNNSPRIKQLRNKRNDLSILIFYTS